MSAFFVDLFIYDVVCGLSSLVDVVQQSAASNVDPLLDDSAHVNLLDVTLHYHLMRAYVLHGVFSDEVEELVVLLLQCGCLHVVNVGAFHAKSHKYLVACEETPPSDLGEGQTTHLYPKLLHDVVERHLLHYLQPEFTLASLAFRSELLHHNVAHHFLQSQVLLCEVEPHSCQFLHVVECDLRWDLPVVNRQIGYGVVRDHDWLAICTLLSFVVWHHSQVLLDPVLLLLQFRVDGLRVNCFLEDVSQDLSLGTRLVHIVLTAKDGRDVVDDPLAVVAHEFMPEGIGLDVPDETLHVIVLVQSIHVGDVDLQVLNRVYLPDAQVARDDAQDWLYQNSSTSDHENEGHYEGILEGVVLLPYHDSDTKD